MKLRTIVSILAITSTILLVDCSDDGGISRNSLLVNVYWFGQGGTTSAGYAVYSPLYFQSNNIVRIGSVRLPWRYIDGGNSIEIGEHPNESKFQIIQVTDKVFHFKHVDRYGNVMADLTYGRCGQLTLGGQPCN